MASTDVRASHRVGSVFYLERTGVYDDGVGKVLNSKQAGEVGRCFINPEKD